MSRPDDSGYWECPLCPPDSGEYWDPVKYGMTECVNGHIILLLYAENGRVFVRLEVAP